MKSSEIKEVLHAHGTANEFIEDIVSEKETIEVELIGKLVVSSSEIFELPL